MTNIKDNVEGNWHEIKGKILKTWGMLSQNDILRIQGNVEELRGLLQKKYGYTKEETDKEITKFCNEHNWQ